MAQYDFKKITVVPSGNDLIDIVLSRTQRQTPTVIHKGNAISRVRQFYMRKDHYKLALGQLNTARNLIKRIREDYVKLLKYGDSLYRCKSLKRAALGRMCTVTKRIGPSLAYLEHVRQHMARLPSINTGAPTILICGCPNVGKSSFLNKITRADVEVQPYAFTTKSLFVGHTDYKYLRYQVIDTPGLLDRPLEDRNIIETCSVTALVNLHAAILFFLDLSGSCGYSISQQAALFHSIKMMFRNNPVLIVCNKTDLQTLEGLSGEDLKLVMEMKSAALKTIPGQGGEAANDQDVLLTMSTITDEGVMAVKNAACQRLLDQRSERKMKSKKMPTVLNRFHVAMPKPRDQKERPVCIPQAVLEARAEEAAHEERKTEKDIENENGGAGVYSASLRKHYILADDDWKLDILPEFLDGHNVYDFIDPDILQRVEELEREETAVEEDGGDFEMEDEDFTAEAEKDLQEIRKGKKLLIQKHRIKKSTAESRPTVPRKFDKDRKFTSERMGRQLSSLGIDPSRAIERARSRSVSRKGRKRERSVGGDGEDEMEIDGGLDNKKKLRLRSRSRSVLSQRPLGEVVPGEGFKDSAQKMKAVTMARNATKKRNKDARRGEADRVIPTLRPKHLFSGKRSIGKTDRR
ncbi:unnamed protein product [Linum trigynum]|uniref:Nucleolar GTP-binding protein 1 n=1 Tax=Linum trigynum TaxID=586398 RepID=A0AAV2CM34_9ROSI